MRQQAIAIVAAAVIATVASSQYTPAQRLGRPQILAKPAASGFLVSLPDGNGGFTTTIAKFPSDLISVTSADPSTASVQMNAMPNLLLSVTPVKITDQTWSLIPAPNPSQVAVYRNGLRLAPTDYTLTGAPDLLPNIITIPAAAAGDVVLVDYIWQ